MRSLPAFVCLLFLAPLRAQNPVPAPPAVGGAPSAQGTLDKGHLDPAWFNLPSGAFGPHDLADFGWVKPGFKLGGRSLKVAWDPPRWTEPNTDPANLTAADEHRASFPAFLQESLRTLAEVQASPEVGELLLVGRLVECNTKGGVLSWAMETITFDLKLVDSHTGETLLALHHRLLGGPGWKGKGSRRRFLAWTETFAKQVKVRWLP